VRGRPVPAMALVLVPALAALVAPGCGYHLGYETAPGVRTVAVPIFQNATFPLRREVEYDLSSAFRQEIQARTDLRIIDESAGPDMIVRGKILEFRERVVAESRTDVKTESTLIAHVELRIENYRDGTLRVEKVSDTEPFSIESGESFRDGAKRAIGNLAEKLVVALEDWDGTADPDAGREAAPPAHEEARGLSPKP
jgi:hypothetical protein